MSQVGALYVDVGVRGLGQATAGLRALGERLRSVGDQARSGLLGALGDTVISGVRVAASAIGTITTAAAAATAALSAMGAGGVYALVALGRSEKAGENLKRITSAFDGLMTKIGDIILMIGELIATQTGIADGLGSVTQTLGELWDEWRPTIAAMIDTAVTLFNTMWDAAKSAFSMIRGAFDSLMSFFGVSLRGGDETWAQTIKRWAEEFQFFVETFRLRLQILWERIKLFFWNSVERARAFGKNIVVVIEWVRDNWREIFETIGNFIVAVFRNAGENIRRIWTSVTDWISGKGWKAPNLRPLTEGFKNTIKEMPQWVEANTKESTERLDQLLTELEQRREAFRLRIAARDQRIAQQQLLGQPPKEQKSTQQFGMVGFADLARRSQEDMIKKLTERQTKAAEDSAEHLGQLVNLALNVGLKIKGGAGSRFE